MSDEAFENLSKTERRELARQMKKTDETKKSFSANIMKYAFYLIALFVIGFIFYSFLKPTSNSVDNAGEKLTVTGGEWIKGNLEANNTLFEFSDFQCPACASYQPIVKQIEDQLGDQLKFIYKHFPLITIHKNAFSASLASEAAGKQAKFWEMHDLLFKFQDDWSNKGDPSTLFEEYARSLELNADKFKEDYASGDLKSKVEKDIALGNTLRINSTPTFYLNGQKLNLPISVEQVKTLLSQ